MKWLKRASYVLAALVVLVILAPWAAGAMMDREHVGRGQAVLAAPIDEVWESISNYDKMSEWAPNFESVKRVADVDGLPSFEVKGDRYSLRFTFVEVVAPKRLVVKLEDDAQYYGGEWTYELASVPTGTRITITEQGWTEPPYFRFMLWLFGHDTTIRRYLAALERRHGSVEPSGQLTVGSASATVGW